MTALYCDILNDLHKTDLYIILFSNRHWCDQGDDLSKYGWELHDGRNIGIQTIVDKHVILQTKFVKRAGGQHGGDWSARISVFPKVDFRLFM